MKCAIPSVALICVCTFSAPCLADPPKIHDLRVQKVGQTTYFHLLLKSPSDLRLPGQDRRFRWWNEWEFARLPRLVPQDGKTSAVYVRLLDEIDLFPPRVRDKDAPEVPQPPIDIILSNRLPARIGIEYLEFLGKVQDNVSPVKFLLQYPTHPAVEEKKPATVAQLLQRQGSWVDVEMNIDFVKAQRIDMPTAKRSRNSWPVHNDLEGMWALSQGRYFAVHQAQTHDFSFYGVARELTSLKYDVPVPSYIPENAPDIVKQDAPFFNRQLYEITTGAGAITESLALNRLRNANLQEEKEPRSVDIRTVEGVTIEEHPWEKMMAGKKPAPEPLAELVPHDNYYVHFKNIGKFLEAGDLVDQWGTTLTRAIEVNSRDYQLKEKLEQQLCLKSGKLARLFGPAVVKSLALTGSDPYFREGSDFTILFHVANKNLFLAAVEPHLQEARKIFAGKLKEEKQTHLDVTIESLVSQLREVSLHRASFGDYVIYSNSPVGIRRIIDVHKGKHKSLASSLDFQYMRTVFRLDDPLEDGFIFLSDPFIRNLVGPALRIKERRRLEALTSLSMANHGALFVAWETGRLPANHDDFMNYTRLKPELLFSPDGGAIYWNAEHKVAYSPFYNTLNFATPLIEIPIDMITPQEQAEYNQFRLEYLGLWRRYFDPIGMRIKLGASEPGAKGEPRTLANEVRWETYILPLVKTSQYNDLRRLAGDGTIKLDPSIFDPKTVAHLISHLSPMTGIDEALRTLSPALLGLVGTGNKWAGEWFSIRMDDSPVYSKILQRAILHEIDRASIQDYEEDIRLLFQVPLTLGIEIRDQDAFTKFLDGAKKTIDSFLPRSLDWQPLQEQYKGTSIVQIKVRTEGPLGAFGRRAGQEPFAPALYYAIVDGAWYVSPLQECIQHEIDAALARKLPKDQAPAKVEVNSTIHVNPQAGMQTKEFIRQFLEWETQQRAVTNVNLLYPLFRSKVVSAADDGTTIQNMAMKFLGFIPASPDKSPYTYVSRTDEIVNKRHGNLRRPTLHSTIDANSPLTELLEQFRSLRADLQFREDGLHSIVTFTRK